MDTDIKDHKRTLQQIAHYFSVEDIISNKEFPANDIVRVNKFNNLLKLYLRTIISVCHV
jgi:hypothetical protein